MSSHRLVATVKSFTSYGKEYKVKMKNDKLSCNCPAWIFNHSGDRTCKHTQAVQQACGDIALKLISFSKKVVDVDGEQWEVRPAEAGEK